VKEWLILSYNFTQLIIFYYQEYKMAFSGCFLISHQLGSLLQHSRSLGQNHNNPVLNAQNQGHKFFNRSDYLL